MSSNIKVKRICEYCNSEFVAQTTATRYCSKKCNAAHYKAKVRAKKVDRSNTETKQIKYKPIQEIQVKEFLTVTQVSKLINCSRQNVYKLINSGKLRATNILEKKTIVKRSDLDKLFNKPKSVYVIKEPQQIQINIADCYNFTEIQNKYSISEKALHDIIKRNNIPKLKKGWYAYVPKNLIDELLT